MKPPQNLEAALVLIVILLFLFLQPIQGQDKSNSGIIKVDGFNLHYVIEGKGKPAIVIGSSVYYPRIFSRSLRNHIKFIFLDHRGFVSAPNDVDTTDYSLDKIILDIEKTRQKLELGKIIIIGHSGHSYMALEYAKAYPKNVTKVVMIGIAPDLGSANKKLIEQTWEESVDPERKKAMNDNLLRFSDEKLSKLSPSQAFIQTYVRNGPRTWYDPHYDSTPLWEGITLNLDMIYYMWGKVFLDIDITKELENFKKPIFLALGRYDNIVAPPSVWDSIRPKFFDLTIRVFEKSGHTPQFEQPELFDQELLNWLEIKNE